MFVGGVTIMSVLNYYVFNGHKLFDHEQYLCCLWREKRLINKV